jgi:hypothetical protein
MEIDPDYIERKWDWWDQMDYKPYEHDGVICLNCGAIFLASKYPLSNGGSGSMMKRMHLHDRLQHGIKETEID